MLPDVWVGEISWLKATLLENVEKYVPSTVGQVDDIIGEELPEIDMVLMAKIEEAFNSPNETTYRLAKKNDVLKWLSSNKGKRVFTISW